jgi:hypothetical protein
MIHRLIGFYRIPPGDQGNKGCDILVYLTCKKIGVFVCCDFTGVAASGIRCLMLLHGEEGPGIHDHLQPPFQLFFGNPLHGKVSPPLIYFSELSEV